jgi:uroporphyrinogen-III synthase
MGPSFESGRHTDRRLLVALLQRTTLVPVSRDCTSRTNRDVDFLLLNRIAVRLSAAAPMHEVLEEVVKFVTAAVECDSCMVYVLEKDDLVLRASKNPHPEVVDRLAMKMGQGITGWVAMNREPVVVAQRAYEDRRFKLFNELPEDRFEAFLSVPVVSGGKLVGVVNVQNRKQHRYSEREITLIATLGVLVGAEIERVRLENENCAYRTMQRESQERRKSMREIAEAIILSDDLKRTPAPISAATRKRTAAAGVS